ncbi:two pore domain potassium channel family protein [Qipengyuania sp. 1NDH17]|uniref:Two pore domain potassium channel family protein n=1 Tax=Qipengyuania polymorpha TaxID=2867234 RepID=A0ABS7IZU0_9SPHN|nr:ion channel [Qipengyuania polymorpha]MBX7459095.1 two pore domain potassium channel family protein [Qipengyuania polymorpha]
MLAQLAIATGMVLVTVTIHGLGLVFLSRILRLERMEEREAAISPLSAQGVAVTFGVVLGLFAIHGLEIWLYAVLYHLGGAFPDLHTAVYFSTITYGTIGYDDEGLVRAWQLVAAIEGINGILLLGWSTAFFVALIARLNRR